jgi:hypothetical protein
MKESEIDMLFPFQDSTNIDSSGRSSSKPFSFFYFTFADSFTAKEDISELRD